MPFDMSLVQRGARLRRSPFFEATQRHGATAYTVYNHMLFPICFAGLEEEYWHLVNHVTLWDVSVERQVEITGRDAAAFTDMLTPRDLSRCAVGQGKYIAITAQDGGIINDPVLLRLGKRRRTCRPRTSTCSIRSSAPRPMPGPWNWRRRITAFSRKNIVWVSSTTWKFCGC